MRFQIVPFYFFLVFRMINLDQTSLFFLLHKDKKCQKFTFNILFLCLLGTGLQPVVCVRRSKLLSSLKEKKTNRESTLNVQADCPQ